jgi:hypothetical protein
VSPTERVSQLINCLTNDEDQRQDLWVHYLSGHSPSTFASHLNKLNREFSNDSELQNFLWDLFKNPPSDKFARLLGNFSNIEQSVVCLLALGLSVSELSGYKEISEIRIRHVISVVRENGCWEELYGVEETTDRRREIRAE